MLAASPKNLRPPFYVGKSQKGVKMILVSDPSKTHFLTGVGDCGVTLNPVWLSWSSADAGLVNAML